MTKQEAKRAALRWLDEATINGAELSSEQTADYTDRMNHLLYGVVDFFAGQFRLPARHTAVQSPVQNLLPGVFSAHKILPGTPFLRTAYGAQSFYAELEGVCTLTITCGGNILFEQNIENPGGFKAVFANLPATHCAQVEFSVNAQYPTTLRWLALYPCQFFGGKVQPHTPYISYQMPDDFRELDSIVHTANGMAYQNYAHYRRESGGRILIPYDEVGQFEFIYWRSPAPLAPGAKEDTVLDIDPRAASLLPLKLAVDLTAGTEETAAISQYLNGQLASLLMAALAGERTLHTEIQPVFSAG